MIYELINGGTHGNDVALYKCYVNGFSNNYYIKASFSDLGNQVIENEHKGYQWYQKAVNKSSIVQFMGKYFFEIHIPEFEGKKYPYNAIIENNEMAIEKLIAHYRSHWLHADQFCIHGDFALCNAIFQDIKEINIIDWEHFHLADREYFGFDVINMIFIALAWQHKNLNHIQSKTKQFLKKCYRTLIQDVPSSNLILEKPFQESNRYLKKNAINFGMSIDIADKFVLARYTDNDLQKLDAMVT